MRDVEQACHACQSRARSGSAARMGPMVCELEGPMPILKRSKRLVFTMLL